MKTTNSYFSVFAFAAAVAFGLTLSGCATATQTAAMVPKTEWHVRKNPQSVAIHVGGGSATSSMGASQIANEDFARAIQQAVIESGVFAKADIANPSDYRLDVQIARLQQPLFGASFNVVLETTWRLAKQSDQSVVWEKSVTSNFTATMGDALAGVTRLRLATEGAVRNNISDAITQIGALTLN
jgi:hypothetical protein